MNIIIDSGRAAIVRESTAAAVVVG